MSTFVGLFSAKSCLFFQVIIWFQLTFHRYRFVFFCFMGCFVGYLLLKPSLELNSSGSYLTHSLVNSDKRVHIIPKGIFQKMNITQLELRGAFNKFQDFFFVWTLLLIVHTWNSSPFRSILLRLQYTCCTVPTTSGRPNGSPLVWACQWPSS